MGERTCSGFGVEERSDLTKDLIREGMKGLTAQDVATIREMDDAYLASLIPLAAATLAPAQTYARAVLAECARRLRKEA